MDCTGCQLCVSACPDKALSPHPLDAVLMATEDANWAFATRSLPERTGVMERATVKGSQFGKPLLEVRGRNKGCSPGRGAGKGSSFAIIRPASLP